VLLVSLIHFTGGAFLVEAAIAPIPDKTNMTTANHIGFERIAAIPHQY